LSGLYIPPSAQHPFTRLIQHHPLSELPWCMTPSGLCYSVTQSVTQSLSHPVTQSLRTSPTSHWPTGPGPVTGPVTALCCSASRGVDVMLDIRATTGRRHHFVLAVQVKSPMWRPQYKWEVA
jgi:hypothetical protein